jgi:hypothetical protein
MPVGAAHPRDPRHERFAGDPHHTASGRRGVDVAASSWRDRHRIVRRAGDPRDRGAGSAPTVFQRTANFSVPAWNGPLDAEAVTAQGALRRAPHAGAHHIGRNPEHARRASGTRLPRSARRVREALRRRRFLPARGLPRSLPATPRRTTCCASSCARRSASVHDLESRSCSLRPPARHQAACGHRVLETYNRDNVRLVSIRERPIDEIRSTACIGRSSSRSTRSCSAPASTR